MPDVSYNQQSFLIDGKRFWLLGASIDYARIVPEQWGNHIDAAAQAGFNTIDVAAPWMIHEPKEGKYEFDGWANVRQFIELCHERGMRVIFRPGPFIGGGYDGGGLPGWLLGTPDIAVRAANEPFLERVGRYFRKLMGEVADLQATNDGPIIAVQLEHQWVCSNDEQAGKYLGELMRFLRERGINVPITNANELWQEVAETIDTWRGWDDLLAHLRQLRTLRDDSPLLVSAFESSATQCWGQSADATRSPMRTLWHATEALAAGGHLVVNPFAGGTNFGFLSGQLSGPNGGPVATLAHPDAPLGEAGSRGEKYNYLKRVISFANAFAHVFAELDPDHRPVAMDPLDLEHRLDNGKRNAAKNNHRAASVSIVGQRGPRGRIIFAFSDGDTQTTSLLLDNGLRMPIHFGDQPVRWYLFDADLGGAGRLDYANVCPFTLIERSIVVFFGPAGSNALLSINGSPIEATIPGGNTPLLLKHRNLNIVIASDEQINGTFVRDDSLYIGTACFDGDGNPIAMIGAKPAVLKSGGDEFQVVETNNTNSKSKRSSSKKTTITPESWMVAPADEHIDGSFPRFASLSGPESLSQCGAPTGYGWYKIEFNVSGTKKYNVAMPGAGDRVHIYHAGKLQRIVGTGAGADPSPFDLRFEKGAVVLTALADNLGRYCDGSDFAMQKGIFDHLYALKALRTNKPKVVEAKPLDPFAVRKYIAHRAKGQLSDREQALWAFKHLKKSPVLVHAPALPISGTFALNDAPVYYYAGPNGHQPLNLLLDPSSELFKRGGNELRFAPDLGLADELPKAMAATSIYECVENLTDKANWSFAKWEPPKKNQFTEPAANSKGKLARPCWWRATFTAPEDGGHLRLNLASMSKGQAYINGNDLGRYFTQTVTGKSVGPQTDLYIPTPWVNPSEPNELLIFDEHGFDARKVKIISTEL